MTGPDDESFTCMVCGQREAVDVIDAPISPGADAGIVSALAGGLAIVAACEVCTASSRARIMERVHRELSPRIPDSPASSGVGAETVASSGHALPEQGGTATVTTNGRRALLVLAAALVVGWLVTVWPTPYRVHWLDGDRGDFAVRVNRITGRVDVLTDQGWTRTSHRPPDR